MNFNDYLTEHEQQLDEVSGTLIARLFDKGATVAAKKLFDSATRRIIKTVAKRFPEVELLRKRIEDDLKNNDLAEDKKREYDRKAERLKVRLKGNSAFPDSVIDKIFEPIDKLLEPGRLPSKDKKTAIKQLSALGSIFKKSK